MLVALAELEEDLADTTLRGRPDFFGTKRCLAHKVCSRKQQSICKSVHAS